MSASTPERQAVLKHAEKLEKEATRLEADARALRLRAAWLYQERGAEDWCNLLLLIKLADAEDRAERRAARNAEGTLVESLPGKWERIHTFAGTSPTDKSH